MRRVLHGVAFGLALLLSSSALGQTGHPAAAETVMDLEHARAGGTPSTSRAIASSTTAASSSAS